MKQPADLLAGLVGAVHNAVDDDLAASRLALHHVVQDIIADEPACVLVADSSGQIVAASQDAMDLLGHTLQSLRELNVTELAGKEDRDSVEPLWESFLQQRRQSGDFVLRRRDGTGVRTHYAARANLVGGLSMAVHVVDEPSTPPKRPRMVSTTRAR